MMKKIEYSIYSYTNDIRKFANNFHLENSLFNEFIFQNGASYIIMRQYNDKYTTIKEEFTDKNKNRKLMCKNVESYSNINNEEFKENFYYFIGKFGYSKVKENKVKCMFYEGSDFNIEITKEENDNLYLIKMYSDNDKGEEIIYREMASMENFCNFIKPALNY
jgi:hypothetical protein